MATIGALPLLRRNALLAGLPAADLEALAAVLEPVDLELKELLYEVGQPIETVVFPVDAVVSLITPMRDGRAVEVATVGREGFVGVPVFLQGAATSAHRAFCQVSGTALRTDAASFARVAAGAPGLHGQLHRYTLALLTQIAQAAACNRLHAMDQRCARWLLLIEDRVGRPTFPMTQEFLAQMLGVRRAGVNEAHRALQDAGLIDYAHGTVTVLDRPGLEARSCECYAVIRDEHARLAAPPG